MGVTLTRILEVRDACGILIEVYWKTSTEARKTDGTMTADLRLLGCEDGMGMDQNRGCVLLLHFLLKRSPNRK
jgi:hypothetical protein